MDWASKSLDGIKNNWQGISKTCAKILSTEQYCTKNPFNRAVVATTLCGLWWLASNLYFIWCFTQWRRILKIHVKKIFPITVWECKMDRFKAVDFKQQQCTMHWWKWLKFQRSKSKDKSSWIGETFFFQFYFSIFCY